LGSSATSSSSLRHGITFSSVKATPTIQALQGRVQILKQAIRIKNSGNGRDEDKLEELARKWTDVGREVAWAVWETVKDLDPGESANFGTGKGGSLDEGWSFDDGLKGKKTVSAAFSKSWGWDESQNTTHHSHEQEVVPGSDDDDDAVKTSHSVGTMLRHLGIDPETLGWDEDEGDFVDQVGL